MNRSDAPWSDDEVASLNAFQQNPGTHPFTGERAADGSETVLVATRLGWVERSDGCAPVVQTWAHKFMTDWSWKKNAQLDSQRLKAAIKAVSMALGRTCKSKDQALQVLMHVTAAYLEGRDVPSVTGYLVKITQMLDGKFDR